MIFRRTCLLGALILVMGLSTFAQAHDSAGFVAAVRGQAQVIRGGEQLDAVMGMEIREGDSLRTFKKSRLKVLFSDDALIALGSNSEVVVTKHLFAAKAGQRVTRLRLVGGKLRALVQKLVAGSRANFQVRTSNAVAGVRGTEFALVAGEKDTQICTFSGAVVFSGPGGEKVLVAAGQGSRLEADGKASRAEALAEAELRRVRRETDTEQEPTALAWNVGLAPTDHLVVSGTGARSASGQTADRENLRGQVDLGGERDPPLDFGEGGKTGDGPGGSRSSFGGDAVTNGGIDGAVNLDGSWENPNVVPDAQGVSAVDLRIVLHRR
ncbi:MAG TPA: FecR family protein [Myxococcota bacterium]|nr:FecR family protein [Myxococcota bacterium]